ncbi:ATPase [Paenibacillus sp. FSL R7-0273]|uniref:N-acetylglucosamine kinase n=1 Tax=Paenibacillus sp. FSL R7-0273 TaxID=1536772 RepID=UPI0004F8A840|nr:BadF/BadG/BcrA/BcrD ATPase family protein [Paenibacillus sp. FSL R7-0273]AIQ47333.1 ATPase [Paenibacillus sp. FSL R7-0273]OMF96113.1 ATPase [Paenibacillus sp. FSL R7-0273]
MNYYLGVDGGGSKTLAVISDAAGRITGRGASGCGNHQTGAERAEINIRQAVEEAMRQAGLRKEQVTSSVFGLAGADREADFRILRPMIAKLGMEPHHIVCDTVIGLRAGTRQSYGAVVICGTGTNCYGINRSGQELQVGGFGYTFGDFGGGGDLAVEAFRSVIRAWEGRGRPTRLTQAILGKLGYASEADMFHYYLDHSLRVPHEIAKLLFEVAAEDETAREILQRQGRELGIAASAVIWRLGMQQDVFDLVLAGSILTRGESRYVVPYISEAVSAAAPGCTLRKLEQEPVAGALLLAMERSGIQVAEDVYEQLHQTLSVKAANAVWLKD